MEFRQSSLDKNMKMGMNFSPSENLTTREIFKTAFKNSESKCVLNLTMSVDNLPSPKRHVFH